ncbi:MAG: class I SAM-dependent methyltransferase [Planctomycetota bacterium]
MVELTLEKGTKCCNLLFMRRALKRITPEPVWLLIRKIIFYCTVFLYRHRPRPCRTGETTKAKARRTKEGFFERFCQGKGLDIGYGGDLLADNCRGWDIEHGDAQMLEGIEDSEFDFVYSSHTLEHLDDAEVGLKNWWRVIKPGGYLILYLPERNLYERKKNLPSRWNNTHRRFFLLDRDEAPDTAGVIPLIQKNLFGYEIIYARVCNEGYKIPAPNKNSTGEYSIEAVIKKN